jgi:hypothetical protein
MSEDPIITFGMDDLINYEPGAIHQEVGDVEDTANLDVTISPFGPGEERQASIESEATALTQSFSPNAMLTATQAPTESTPDEMRGVEHLTTTGIENVDAAEITAGDLNLAAENSRSASGVPMNTQSQPMEAAKTDEIDSAREPSEMTGSTTSKSQKWKALDIKLMRVRHSNCTL